MTFNSNHKDSILLIEKDSQIRSRLVQAARAEKRVSHVLAADSLPNALRLLRENEGGDIIFMSHSFNPHETMEFVMAAKNTKHGRDAAYIGKIQNENLGKTGMAEQLLKGMDGFLSAPFTTEMVQSSIVLAGKIKFRKLISRVAVANRLILTDFMRHLDYATYDAKFRKTTVKIPESVYQGSGIIRTYCEQEQAVYFQILLEMFSNVSPPNHFLHSNVNSVGQGHISFETDHSFILSALADADWQKRAQAIDKISRMDAMNQMFIPELTTLLSDANASCRRKAKLTLSKIRSKLDGIGPAFQEPICSIS